MEQGAAFLGAVLGSSASPEIIFAVVAVVIFSRTRARFWLGFAVAAVAVVALRAVLLPGFIHGAGVAITVASLLLWSGVGAWARPWIVRLRQKARSGA